MSNSSRTLIYRPVQFATVSLVVLACLVGGVSGQSSHESERKPKYSSKLADLIKAGDYSSAGGLATIENPDDQALFAWLKIREGKVEEGLELARSVYSTGSDGDVTEESLLSMIKVVGDASPDVGITILRDSLINKELSDKPALWIALLNLYGLSQKAADGCDVADHVIEKWADSENLLTPLYNFCTRLYMSGQPELAHKYYSSLTNHIPKAKIDPGYQLQFSHIMTAADKPLDALSVIDSIQTDFPDYSQQNSALLAMGKGLAYEKLGDFSSAKKEFEKVVSASHPQGSHQGLAALAAEKIVKFKEDEAFRNLKDESPDLSVANNSKSPVDDQSGLKSIFVVFNGFVLVVAVVYWLFRRMAHSGKA